ncbi:MAG: response regulator [Gammaproteobacteria bacterium]|nr:response regulator [Gammaproteobacteria bacterium]
MSALPAANGRAGGAAPDPHSGAAGGEAAPEVMPEDAVPDKTPVNILLVDDQPAKLLSYESILAGLGERLVRAASGLEALQILLKIEVAVVLIDVCMPEIDGFELTSMIREHPRLSKTSLILVSGVTVEDDARLKGYDSGAVDYVSVPIIPEILRAKVAVFAELFRKNHALENLNRELEQRVEARTAQIEKLLVRAEDARREAEAANRLKDEFLATISHELRTPLHAISGWIEILKVPGVDAATRAKAVETIERNARLQGRLVGEILDVSRIITGRLRLELAPLDLNTVVEAAIDTLRPTAAAKDVALHAALGTAPVTLTGDAQRLQQVVWNLVSNGVKFAQQGGNVWVALGGDETAVELTVLDDGPGIAPEFLPYIFERFRQGDSSSTRPHQGLGLGLAIVRHLVEMHGGRVDAANRSDRPGARFVVRLPRAAVEWPAALQPATTQDAREKPESALSGVRVLVVDDEADGREAVAALLEKWGAAAHVASSASEAYALVPRALPHVLIADIEMPGEDGYTLVRRLRALPAAEGGALPAVALTAYAGPDDRARALAAGFQAHLAKPVEPLALLDAVRALAAPAGER